MSAYCPAPANDGRAEQQYIDLVRQIIDHGDQRPDRTGVGTRALHGAWMRFNLNDGTIPLLTTKRVPWRAVVHELLWFLDGSTNIRPLLNKGVHIWSDWPHAAYVKATGEKLSLAAFEQRIIADEAFARKWGELGPVYGKQWRRWEGPDGQVHDQIAGLVARLRADPYSRRLLFHGWNVAEIDQMALPPCHLLYQYFVANGKLSCTLYQRSCDVGLGVPFNIVSAAVLLRMLAHQCDLDPGELLWFGHDVHLYNNQIAPLKEHLLTRVPRAAPTLAIKQRPPSLFDYDIADFGVTGYEPHPAIAMDVAV